MKHYTLAVLVCFLFVTSLVWAQQPAPVYKFSMPTQLTGIPDMIEDGESYNLSVKMFNTGNVRFFVGDKVQMRIKIGSHAPQNIGGEITLTDDIFPVSAGTGLLDSLVWQVPNYEFETDKFGGGGTSNDIIIWPTVMRAGSQLDPTPDSAYKSIFYVTGAAFRVNNHYITGVSGAIQFTSAYLIDVRAENVGISSNNDDVVFYAQIDEDENLVTEIARITDNVPVGNTVGSTIHTFKPYLLFPNANLSTGQHYLYIFAKEQGLNNVVQKAVYPIIAGTFPVSLKSFIGKANYAHNRIDLEWITELESANKEFIIQKYLNENTQFETLATVEGKGNNLGETKYNLTDLTPSLGNNYYRLIQKDIDGTTQILETITVIYQAEELRLISVSPNPSSEVIRFQLFNGLTESVKIELFDTKGKSIFSQKNENTQGTIEIPIDVSYLPQGVYYYKVSNIHQTFTGSIVVE